MKRVLVFLCSLLTLTSAMNLDQIRQFVSSSVTAGNATFLGFESAEQTSRMVFGPAVALGEVNGDSLKTYPSTGFSSATNIQYLPVIVDGSVRCFVVIDSTGNAVSLGYTQLARDLSATAVQYGIALEDIRLYSSTQINSYLISIPSKLRAGISNLVILQPNWNSNSRAELPAEAVTIDQIRRAGGSK